MKIKRSLLERIIREELALHAARLLGEAPRGEDPELEDAHDDNKDRESKRPPTAKQQGKAPESQPPAQPPAAPQEPRVDGGSDGPPPDGEQPAAEAPPEQDDPAAADAESDEATGSSISDELAGKTVGGITMEPKSKILPGFTEIKISFNEIGDPLRILVGKSGQVRYYFRGLHNDLGSSTTGAEAAAEKSRPQAKAESVRRRTR